MTIVEALGGLLGGAAAAGTAYAAVASKIDAIIGKKPTGDDSLRDVLLRVEGKLDGQGEQIERLTGRVANIEHRVFTPPGRFAVPAMRAKPR